MSKMTSVPSTLSIEHVSGNAPAKIKRMLAYSHLSFFSIQGSLDNRTFADEVNKSIVVTEVSVLKNKEEETRDVGRVVFELEVTQGMLNRLERVHGACSAYLVDIGSTMALLALALLGGESVNFVSSNINVSYHSPASIGDKLRVVNTSLTMGARSRSASTEIWNATHHRLVASGVQVQMQPSESPKARL